MAMHSTPARLLRASVACLHPAVLVSLFFLGCGMWPPLAFGQAYWGINHGTASRIQRAQLDGNGVTDLIPGLGPVMGLALDVSAGKVYWTERWPSCIRRADLDGSHIEDLVTTGLGYPNGIDLDTVHGHMYWADNATDNIKRANLDGSGVVVLCYGGLDPVNLALDVPRGKMYWTSATDNLLRRANMDGSAVEAIARGCFGSGGDVAVDQTEGKLWWASECDTIYRADLDGGNSVPVFVSYTGRPSLVLDPLRRLVYWFAWDGKMRQGSYDGGPPLVLLEGIPFVEDLAVNASGAVGAVAASWGRIKAAYR